MVLNLPGIAGRASSSRGDILVIKKRDLDYCGYLVTCKSKRGEGSVVVVRKMERNRKWQGCFGTAS